MFPWKLPRNPPSLFRGFFVAPPSFLPEVLLGDVGAVPELAEVADPDVPLEAHQDGAVDRAHHGNLRRIQPVLRVLCDFTKGGLMELEESTAARWNVDRG